MKYIIPLIILLIVLSGLKNKTPVYQTFIDGVFDGMKTLKGIFPVILSITMAVSMLKASGAMNILTTIMSPVTQLIGMPKEVMPLVLIRPLSGGGAMGVLTDILKEYHPDSFIGFLACVIMGSTETTFYTLMVYFKNTRVKYIKHIIPAALFGDIVGVMTGLIVSRIIF